MSALHAIDARIDGRTVRLLRGGTTSDSPTLVFIHGGVPGLTPYCSGAHIWGSVLDQLATQRDVVALDLPGAGGTTIADEAFTFETLAACVRGLLDARDVAGGPPKRIHLIGHDLGGLVALDLATSAAERIAAVTVVACAAAAPSGDLIENLTFAHPPHPPFSRTSQRWALERVAHSHHWIDGTVLDACMTAAAGQPHRNACERMARDADRFHASVTQAKTRLYERCRSTGIDVPVQIIAGSHDPLTTLDQSLWLFKLIAARQSVAQMHAINRAGALPFRYAPESFVDLVNAFADGIAGEAA